MVHCEGSLVTGVVLVISHLYSIEAMETDTGKCSTEPVPKLYNT